MALVEILEGDEQRDRAANRHSRFGDSDKTRFALQLMAAVLLRKGDGATSLDQNTLVEGVREICAEKCWQTRERERAVMTLGEESPDDFVESLRDLRLVLTKDGQTSFQHDVWRDYLAGMLLVKAGWARQEVDFARVSRLAWQDAVLLAIELTKGCVEPIKRTLKDVNADRYARRRAAEVWQGTNDIDVEGVIALYDINDSIISDIAGHVLREKAIKSKSFNRRIQQRCTELFQSSNSEDKGRATHIATGLGDFADKSIKSEVARLIADATASPGLRASAIYVTQQFGFDKQIVDALAECCLEQNSLARNAAWSAVWARAGRSRSRDLMIIAQNLTDQFLEAESAPLEQFHLIGHLARSPWLPWVTQRLVRVFIELGAKAQTEEVRVTRWYLARFLCGYWHLRSISQQNLVEIARCAGDDPILRSELNELFAQAGAESLALTHEATKEFSSDLEEFDLWSEWMAYMRTCRKNHSGSYNFYSDTLALVTLIYRFFGLSEEQQDLVLDQVEEILTSDRTTATEYLIASLFMSRVGVLDERGQMLRRKSMEGKDAQVVALCVGATMRLLQPYEQHIFEQNIVDQSKDMSVRWNSGAALLRFSPHLDVESVIRISEIMLRDPAALTRGLIYDLMNLVVQDTDDPLWPIMETRLIAHLNVESDPYALARLVRTIGKIGTKSSVEPLEILKQRKPLTDSVTRLGRISDLVDQAIASIENALELPPP